MKTAEELWDEHKETIFGYELMDSFNFKDALTEQDNEIKQLIDDMIESVSAHDVDYSEINGYTQALTELKGMI